MSASAGMSTGMSASAAGASAVVSDNFRAEFTQYNDIHVNLKDTLSQFNTSYGTLGTEINAAHKLPEGTIKESVNKKNTWEQLKPKLQVLTKEYPEIHDGIKVNNGKLEELKIRIKAAIATKKLAAAAAKADRDATAAQALADARQAIQTQITLLNELKNTRQTAFDNIVESKSTEVNHIVNIVIPNKLIDIKQRLQAEHISETTRELVEGIETSITKSIRDEFQRISTQFNAKHKSEIEAIDENIKEWTYVMGGNDIQTMLSANASTVTQISSTILDDFINGVIALVDTELGKLDSAKADAEAAASRDLKTFQEEEAKINEFKMKIDEVVDSEAITAIIKSIDDKIKEVNIEYNNVNTSAPNEPPLTKQLKITRYSTSITGLNAELMALDNAIIKLLLPFKSVDTIQQQLNDIQKARKSRGIDAQTSLSILNQKIQGFQDKRKEFIVKYNEHHDNHERISAELRQSRFPSPIVPVPPSERRPTSAAPTEAWTEEQTKKPTTPTYGPILAEAALESENITPPRAPITGARRNFLHISHNTNPPTAYLVVVKKPRLDDSRGQDGGNKPYHIQKGGAGDPPPDKLPENSEIFPINVDVDVDNPTFLGVMAGLIPPNVLLKVNDDGGGEHPIIQKIRRGTPLLGNNIALYNNIKRELITQENKNPLTIGLRAVYYRNIIELIRYLDKILLTRPHIRRERRPASASASSPQPASSPGIRPASASSSPPPSRGISPLSIRLGAASAAASVEPPLTCEYMYTRLRNFLNYTHGTYGVVAALFKKTFRREIDSVIPISIVDKKKEIKIIVGWENNTSNTNFNKLIDIFSKDCPPKNKFLTRKKPTNLGSNPYAYNQFRLNWIILLAFHTLYIKKTEPERVGELIKALYDAFLGWMTMTGHKDTTMRIFSNTLGTKPDAAYSDEVEKQITKIVVGDPTLQPLVKNIQDKLCELEKDNNPVIEVLHGDEYEDKQNDSDYIAPEEASDSSEGGTSEAAAEMRLLSPPEKELGKTRSQRLGFRRGPMTPDEIRQSGPPVPPGDPDPNWVVQSEYDSENSDDESKNSDVEITQRPLPLPLGEIPVGQSGPLSERRSEDRRHATLAQLKGMGVKDIGKLPIRPSSSQSKPQSDSVTDQPRRTLRTGVVSPFHKVVNRDVKFGTRKLPWAVEQQQRSQPAVLSQLSPRNSPSSDVFLRTQRLAALPAAPTSTPAPHSRPRPAPPSEPLREGTPRRTPLTKRVTETGTGGERGGNNKKRTRKHKKHTSISASRRPTRRRRRIPPTEGHKYTRKHPRT
jgi:hypothetical protein